VHRLKALFRASMMTVTSTSPRCSLPCVSTTVWISPGLQRPPALPLSVASAQPSSASPAAAALYRCATKHRGEFNRVQLARDTGMPGHPSIRGRGAPRNAEDHQSHAIAIRRPPNICIPATHSTESSRDALSGASRDYEDALWSLAGHHRRLDSRCEIGGV